MFYIKFGLKKNENELPRSASDAWGVAARERGAEPAEYFQIYENGMPLAGLSFHGIKDARNRLRGLVDELNIASNGWYRVENRSALKVRNVLGVRKIYSDGSAVNTTYVIRRIKMKIHYQ